MLHHNYIGTEHLLLGLMHEGEGVAAKALTNLGYTLEQLRAYLHLDDTAGVTGHIPFTPECKRVLELALREALQLGHPYIGTEHILLAMCRESSDNPDTIGQKMLNSMKMYSRVRYEVISILTSFGPSPETKIPQIEDEEPMFDGPVISVSSITATVVKRPTKVIERIEQTYLVPMPTTLGDLLNDIQHLTDHLPDGLSYEDVSVAFIQGEIHMTYKNETNRG